MARLVIVSNRVALPRPTQDAASGGLAVALREALVREGGLWMGWSGKVQAEADFQPHHQEARSVSYVTFDLSPEDHQQFYVQYSNSTVWPLFHYRIGILDFRRDALEGYRRVNEAVARMLLPLLRPDDIVWIHDYHFIPLGSMLRELGVRNKIGFFLHIPFPTPEVMRTLPSYEAMISSLAAYDLVGLQTQRDADACRALMTGELGAVEAQDGERLELGGRRFAIRAFPISIDVKQQMSLALKALGTARIARLRQSLGQRTLVVGADRLDYSKGIDRRLDAVEALLERYREHRSRLTYLQLAPLSREEVAQYQKLRQELESKVGLINGHFGEIDWTPIRWVNRGAPRAELAGIYRMAKVGLVTPLRDGMNLVAKEYVASQDAENPGVLVLSRFAGAADELDGALLVNPFDAEAVADTLHRALVMPLEERRERWAPMMEHLKRHDVQKWCADYLAALADA